MTTKSTDAVPDTTVQRSPDPAEGGPEPGLPGADRETPPPLEAPGQPGDELPARLGERIGVGPGGGGAIDDPDLLPNVEVPETAM
jgi:hypothetical protein